MFVHIKNKTARAKNEFLTLILNNKIIIDNNTICDYGALGPLQYSHVLRGQVKYVI